MSYTDAYISATRGTKENPYSSFSEAMKDGREGQNVYIGKTGVRGAGIRKQPVPGWRYEAPGYEILSSVLFFHIYIYI